jgi:hypothetical protein
MRYRFYLVSWIGERVVADICRAVFDRVIALSVKVQLRRDVICGLARERMSRISPGTGEHARLVWPLRAKRAAACDRDGAGSRADSQRNTMRDERPTRPAVSDSLPQPLR